MRIWFYDIFPQRKKNNLSPSIGVMWQIIGAAGEDQFNFITCFWIFSRNKDVEAERFVWKWGAKQQFM